MAQLKEFNQRQIYCLQDGITSGILSREEAHHDFKGKQHQHDSRTVYSLVEKGCFTETTFSHWNYPLSVTINKDNFIVCKMFLYGKRVFHQYKNHLIDNDGRGLEVIGFGLKNGELYFKFHAGSNVFRPVNTITKYINHGI